MEGDELHNGGIFDKDQRKSNLVRELPDFDERRPNAYAGSSSQSVTVLKRNRGSNQEMEPVMCTVRQLKIKFLMAIITI